MREELTEDFVAPANNYVRVCAEGRRSMGIETRSLFGATAHAPVQPLNALFVYGILMRGERLFHAVSRHPVRCALLARERRELRNGGAFPALIFHPDLEVEIEFVRFRGIASALEELDRIEGFDGFGAGGNLLHRK